jgi:uncharacterized protein YjbI with pentapeptide repeats
MNANLNNIAEELFGKIRTRFPKIDLGDEQGKVIDNEDQLKNARFFNANLTAAEFEGAILPEFQIPQKVELIVWKKLSGATSQHYDTRIAKLLIPADAMRTASLIGKKCRAERVVVLEIVDLSTGTEVLRASSLRNANFIYRVGETIVPDGHTYNHDFRHECKPGIHFFMTRGEAISYFM